MSTLSALEELVGYVPALILHRIAGDAAATMAPAISRFPAAVLFADLSGFTALTEQLARQSPAGAEELTRILDLYFEYLVGVVLGHGGDVVKFAGDGLLALWYGDEPLATLAQRAVQCALGIQMMMTPEAWLSLEGSDPLPLKVRLGVAAGEVTIMHLGGVFGRWELLVTGAALAECGRAESEATPGEVVIAPSAWPMVAPACLGQPLASGSVRLRNLTDALPVQPLSLPRLVPAMNDALRAYIPKAVLARLDAAQIAWLAEQRRITVLFVNLPDLQADLPLPKAQALMRALQAALYRYEGSITRLGTDGKGPTLVAALGLPPLAHEDDPERGARAALAIAAALEQLGLRGAIGVSTGRALCGAVGAPSRREYTMMGPMVNRAARLMQAAAALPAQAAVICDEATYRAACAHLSFEPLPPLSLKGFATPVVVYRPLPTDQPALVGAGRAEVMLGRLREHQLLVERLGALGTGNGGVVIIEGDAGIGKSALLAHLISQANEANLLLFHGSGSPVDALPYHGWRPILLHLLALLAQQTAAPQTLVVGSDGVAATLARPGDLLLAPVAAQGLGSPLAQRMLEVLTALELESLAPLLNPLLDLDLPENSRTAQLSGQVRAENTRTLLLRLLGYAASQQPLILAFDDAQWLDASSWALLYALAEQAHPILLVVLARPLPTVPTSFQRLAYLPHSLRLQLRGLDQADLGMLLARRLGVTTVPTTLVELISARAQGNPFVAEELLYALRERGALVINAGQCRLALSDASELVAAISLPDTVEGLLISRIDRLPQDQQLTLKVASVIGPLFTLEALMVLHPAINQPEVLVAQLFALQQAGLVQIERFEPDLAYTFNHVIGCEVAYNLMSFAQRRRLHRQLAEWLEASTRAAPAQLAHHWHQAEEPARAMGYLATAGANALRSGAYREAADALSRALALADRPETPALATLTRARWERQLGEAYHGMGRLIASREQLERAAAHLGYPIHGRTRQRPLAITAELLRQVRSIFRADRLRPRPDGAIHSEAARVYALLAQLAYYDGQLAASTYAALRGLNLAERAGLSPSLAGGYAATQLAAGVFPPLARLYRRRARVAAQALGHLPTEGWLAEAEGLAALGQARWRKAAAAFALSSAIASHLGDQRRLAECLAASCLTDCLQARHAQALAGCTSLQQLGAKTGDAQVWAWGLIGAAENLLALGQDGQAMSLLGEAEALLAENFGGARAEEIWLYALMARAALRRGDQQLARSMVDAAAKLIERLPPAALYGLGGYSAIAEVYLALWAGHPPTDASGRAELAARAKRACLSLAQFALIFPVAWPAALVWGGRQAQLAGNPWLARWCLHQARRIAQRQAMPGYVALAERLLGQG
ncbi:MAG: AAA family ATPase [Oscillochloridaceae bacterium umkhey_bin13]